MRSLAATIRPAQLSDLDVLERLENDAFSGDRLSRRSLRYFVKSETVDFLVAELDDEPVADAIVAYRRNSSAARLYTLAVRPDMNGRGLGRRLLDSCEDHAKTRAKSTLQLEVRSDNAAALRLYERSGYRHFGTYEEYYEDGATAIRLEKTLA